MKYYGICPASCGEFVQGFIKDKEYLCSYAIDLYSMAILEKKEINILIGPPKSRRAMELVFEHFNIPKEESYKVSLEIKSNIPLGKGMASSTADIGATIMATASFLNKTITPEQASLLASKIEATDSLYIEKYSIFNPTEGTVLKRMDNFKTNPKVIILEPREKLRTTKLRQKINYKDTKLKNRYIIEEAFHLLEEGIYENDFKKVGRACTMSSLANENILPKPYLREIIEISENYGAYGVNIAHSGTVIGIIIDEYMDDKKLIDKLVEKNINSYYKKIYTKNIISSGLGGENYGIYQESNGNRRKEFYNDTRNYR